MSLNLPSVATKFFFSYWFYMFVNICVCMCLFYFAHLLYILKHYIIYWREYIYKCEIHISSMLYSKWSSLTMFCPLVTSLHMYFCSGCVYVFEIDASLSEIYITSWPCVSKSVQHYWFCIVFKWNKYLWLISFLIVWWNLIIEKKLLNFDYIPMQMYTSDYLRKIFALMYTIFFNYTLWILM